MERRWGWTVTHCWHTALSKMAGNTRPLTGATYCKCEGPLSEIIPYKEGKGSIECALQETNISTRSDKVIIKLLVLLKGVMTSGRFHAHFRGTTALGNHENTINGGRKMIKW